MIGNGRHGGGNVCGCQSDDGLKFAAAEVNTLLEHVKSVKYLTEHLLEIQQQLESLSELIQNKGSYAKDQGDYAKEQGDYAKAQGQAAVNGPINGNRIVNGTISWAKLDESLQTLIRTAGGEAGAITQEFGNNRELAISQKTLTDAINALWDKIGDITGETYGGFSMYVNPQYFYGEQCQVHIVVSPAGGRGPFEKLKIYANSEVVAEAENVETALEYDLTIDRKTILTCEAQIMGETYTETRTIEKFSEFWAGAADEGEYADIMNNSHRIQVNPANRYTVDIAFADNQKLYIVLNKDYGEILRADMNGFEIPMTKTVQTIDNVEYYVYESDNNYNEGTYNIDING